MDFEDILEMLINPGEDGAPDDIFDQLRGAHDGAVSGRDSVIEDNAKAFAGLQAQNEALMQEIVNVKAANFDKLMGMGVTQDSDPDLSDKTSEEKESDGEMETNDFFSKGD